MIVVDNYTDKSFTVVGDTKALKDNLKKIGGLWRILQTKERGWIFKNKDKDAVISFLKENKVPFEVHNRKNLFKRITKDDVKVNLCDPRFVEIRPITVSPEPEFEGQTLDCWLLVCILFIFVGVVCYTHITLPSGLTF